MLIDEAHLVPHDGDGMYRSLLSELRALAPATACGSSDSRRRRFGSTAAGSTRARARSSMRSFSITTSAAGIRDGWLSPLTSKATSTEINVSGVGRRGGEFIAGELERAADDKPMIAAACDEIVERGADRRSWLVFCCGVLHAHHVCDALRVRGIACRGGDRRDAVSRARGQHRRVQGRRGPLPRQRQRADDRLRCAADRPAGDAAADAVDRPLRANGRPRHAQGGRQGQLPDSGLRRQRATARAGRPGRHQGRRRQRRGRRADSVRTKACPDCAEINALDAAVCCCCGYECPKPKPVAKHATSADAVPIFIGERVWLPVADVSFHRHGKYGDPDAPPTLRVEYLCGLSSYAEYVCFERQGYARTCAERWWYALSGPRRSRRRWPRRCSASTSSIRWSRSRSPATASSGTSPIAASGARTAASSRSTGIIVAG